MMQQPSKYKNNKIRNKIIAVFVLAQLLILGFGTGMYYLSNKAAETIDDKSHSSSGGRSRTVSGSDVDRIEYDVDHIARYSFLFLSLGTVAFMGLMFDLMFSITPALKRLTFAINEIDGGNFDYRLKLPLNNELGDLSRTLNQALDKVLISEKALAREKAEVELLVDQRTEQLRFEQAKFLASINGLPLGFMLVDSNRHILMLNPAMGKLLQLQAETDEQFDANVKSAGAYLENILNSSQETLLSGKTTTSESTTPDGRYLRALFSPLTLRDADLRYVVIVIEDITEEKILERSKDDFFSIATHELRTPLTAIRGSTELITDFYTEALQDDRLKSLIANIHNSSERLLSIVNDFLDASKLEQGSFKLKPQTIYIKTVIQTVLQEISSVAEKKSLYVKADMGSLGTLPFVHADPERVEQILYNLIGNALKFVETGGVTVAADVQGNMLKVYVTDTGRGISAENQQLLFRKFQQANAGILVRDSSPGTGLGLYIAKMLTEAMGGTIGLESSELDVGSCFSFSLPLAKDKDPETLVG